MEHENGVPFFTVEGDYHEPQNNRQQSLIPHPLEQGQADRPETAAQAEGNLGDPNTASSWTNGQENLPCLNLAIDSKLRGCGSFVGLKVSDVAHKGGRVSARAIVMQKKTRRPVQFEITEQTRESLMAWISQAKLSVGPVPLSKPHSWFAPSVHRQYSRSSKDGSKSIGS